MKTFDNYLFHASAWHKLKTDPKSSADKASGELSATTKTYLREIYAEEKHSRKKEIGSKYIEKGKLQEEEAITLYCRLHKKVFHKNEERLNSTIITGEPDITDNIEIMKSEIGVDVKCAWDVFTMPTVFDKLKKEYLWQDTCYMHLIPNVKEWRTAHCLVNAPPHMIVEEKKRVYYALGLPAEDDPEYKSKCLEVERAMIFNMAEFLLHLKTHKIQYDFETNLGDWTYDIALKERVYEFIVKRDDVLTELDSLESTAISARLHLNSMIRS